MIIALVILIISIVLFWLIFFKFNLLTLTPGKGVIFAFVGVHFLLVFVIGFRFVTPRSTNVVVVQHTIQLVPRLPEPTLVTDVFVKDNVLVKKGEPLFQFDRRPYEYKVQQVEAELVQVKQNVRILKTDVEIANQKLIKSQADLNYAVYQKKLFDELSQEKAVKGMDVQKWATLAIKAKSEYEVAQANLENARVKYESEINGVHTSVANLEAQLSLAKYYLENTTLVAPEDGRIMNIQVRPGMVSGIIRFGGIAAFIAEADRYLLATFYQENLKYVQIGQPVEVALNLYPGQIFEGKVNDIWQGNGEGQFLPSANITKFEQPPSDISQNQYAVKIILSNLDQTKFPIGAQGHAAIYTSGEHGTWAALRKIAMRTYSWLNWLYPLNI